MSNPIDETSTTDEDLPSTAGQGGAVHEDAREPEQAGSSDDAGAAQAASDEALAKDDASGTAPATDDEAAKDHTAVGIGVPEGTVPDGPSHHGNDGQRDTLTAGESQHALGSEQEQRLPAMSQNNASEVDKIAGIVAQTRQDVGSQTPEEVQRILAQRFDQAGIDLPESEVAELAKQVTTGDA